MRVNLENLQDKEKTQEINFVGVNFKENISLSKRYEDYLIQARINGIFLVYDFWTPPLLSILYMGLTGSVLT